MKTRRAFFAAATSAVVALSFAACGSSEGGSFPPSQIEVIVPWAAGGGADQATRQLAIQAETTCSTRFVISNRTGAAGATGHEAIVGAAANGSTLGTMTAEATILPHTGGTTAKVNNFTPIIRFAGISPALVVAANSPYKTVADLAAAMKAGESLHVGTTGTGGIWDIAAGGFSSAVGAPFTEHVPYDGGASIIQAILGGHIDVAMLAAPEVVEQYKAGELRVLAVAGEERAAVLPDVPTLAEEGYDWATGTWFGIVGPSDLDASIVTQLESCLTKAWNSQEYQDFLQKMGFNPAYLNSADFASFIKEQDKVNEQLVAELYN